ncbi:MAG: outer membrane protein transport protein [Bacteroidaceae bacterium]|nr:outer membrane protein transport protein [Bacteroidaceae bacterium]
MKKRVITLCSLYLMLGGTMTEVWAGDYLTNTNQSIGFLRNPSRDAAIDIDGVYYNPAGVSFLDEGWHFQFNWQSPHQKRDSRSSYGALFGANYLNPGTPEADGSASRLYKGRVHVPIQPSLYLAYNKNDWAFQFGFGIIGGGGTCEFKNGVGSFEALVGQMAKTTMEQMNVGFGGYSLDSYLKGKSYFFGTTLAAARKLNEKLSVSLGIRAIYAWNNYDGYIDNITFRMQTNPNDYTIVNYPNNYVLDCKQTGLGLAPIIGIDYKVNDYVNLAAKYEFRTPITVKADAKNNDAFNQMAGQRAAFANYLDEAETQMDLPGYLAVGVQVTPIEKLRLNAGYHMYFDRDTRQWSKDLVKDTNEFTLGAAYDLTDRIEVSAGYQKTMYDQSEANYSDLSFNLNSYSFGLGVGVKVTDKVKLNAAYFQTNYKDHTQTTAVSNIVYHRENRVFGVGVDVNF